MSSSVDTSPENARGILEAEQTTSSRPIAMATAPRPSAAFVVPAMRAPGAQARRRGPATCAHPVRAAVAAAAAVAVLAAPSSGLYV